MRYQTRKVLYKASWITGLMVGMAFVLYHILGIALEDYQAKIQRETPITLSEVPQQLQYMLKSLLGVGEIKEVEKITTKDTVAYEFEAEKQGVEFDITVTEGGDLIKIGRQVDVDKAPESLVEKLKADYPSMIIKSMEKKQIVYYQVQATINGIPREFRVHPDGREYVPEQSGE